MKFKLKIEWVVFYLYFIQVERAGRSGYTCLIVNGVDCASSLPKHCDMFFNQTSKAISHSITVTGYGQVK